MDHKVQIAFALGAVAGFMGAGLAMLATEVRDAPLVDDSPAARCPLALQRLVALVAKARKAAPLITARIIPVPLADLVAALGLEPEDPIEAKAFELYRATLAAMPDLRGDAPAKFAALQWVKHTSLPGGWRLRAHYRRLAQGDLTTNGEKAA